jgi:hypothetical protein
LSRIPKVSLRPMRNGRPSEVHVWRGRLIDSARGPQTWLLAPQR